MTRTADIAVVGTGPSGALVASILAAAGAHVVAFERGPDLSVAMPEASNWRDFPNAFARPRGDYVTIRATDDEVALPYSGGWTATVVGGGSVTWGTWTIRPQPFEFALRSFFADVGSLASLEGCGYSVVDWPFSYASFEPFLDLAEALLGVAGDASEMAASVQRTPWATALSLDEQRGLVSSKPHAMPPYPLSPAGTVIRRIFDCSGMDAVTMPCSIVPPGTDGYDVAAAASQVLGLYQALAPLRTPLNYLLARLSRRSVCTSCGFCGGHACPTLPSAKASIGQDVIGAAKSLENFELKADARVVRVERRGRSGFSLSYLNSTDDGVKLETLHAGRVCLAAGGIQTPRLLQISGLAANDRQADLIGRYATFHTLGPKLTARSISDVSRPVGHAGSLMSLDWYVVPGNDELRWLKGGTIAGVAPRNRAAFAQSLVRRGIRGGALTSAVDDAMQAVELRYTGEDLPRSDNRIDLDPRYVDSHGLPVARVTRRYGAHEELLEQEIARRLGDIAGSLSQADGVVGARVVGSNSGDVGEHLLGSCPMGSDPSRFVVNDHGEVHGVPGLHIVDTSTFPTALGANPMLTLVAVALRCAAAMV